MSNKENVDIEISEAKEPITETSDDKLMKVLLSDFNSDLNFFISNKKTRGVIAKKPMKNLTELNVNGPMLSIPVS